ncbi:MAG: hypothetical protein LUG18_08635 [Candidatus Azobacteroides sp.]|nr:hypothetical protein [Candidatus Azobacteroides sp.]
MEWNLRAGIAFYKKQLNAGFPDPAKSYPADTGNENTEANSMTIKNNACQFLWKITGIIYTKSVYLFFEYKPANGKSNERIILFYK